MLGQSWPLMNTDTLTPALTPASSSDLNIVFATNNPAFSARLMALMATEYPQVAVCTPDDPAARHAQVAACWHPPVDLLQRCPGLQLLQAVSAGVDHLGDILMHSGLPVSRVVDEGQQQGMLEYVLWGVLHHQRDFDLALSNQQAKIWQLHPQRQAGRMRIGVMGLGQLGGFIAARLAGLGYPVSGWAGSRKQIEQVHCYAGEAERGTFLSSCDLLVNLLPLTTATEAILDASLFAELPPGAVVMNCGRGEHLNEQDLIDALSSGHLRAVVLDVFAQEPLPKGNPLWDQAGVIVTPHMASSASGQVMLAQLVENGYRQLAGQPLRNLVDIAKGY
ncbi:glyoxylate/hydroxypyruvate reductase A [Oceanobacter sp. 4_MG-2023]|uniref:2-hydroxyacid dehydrogenase n=1 Tax=Oceanobacter sp. 4_MG-2023 TaxID=3062623 RepID=UPI0027376525|nr:glyoxylate/hydroxypyruvate reductase A [Oceanobacter sp. 4_MG-2023]MDP2547126.1 glyoxylate/hydroxypyruvate reductase A [Oceanobacter sp. 4_MG-2023]